MVDKKYLLEYRGITIAIIILSILILALAIRVLPYNILAFIYLVMFLLIPCIRGLCLSKKICIFEKGIEEENIFGVEKSSYLWEEIYEIKISSSDIGLKYTEIHFYIKQDPEEQSLGDSKMDLPRDIIKMKYRKAAMERIEKYSGKKVIWMVDKIRYF